MADTIRELGKQAQFVILDWLDKAGYEVRRSRRSSNPLVPPYYIRSLVGNYDYPEHYEKVGNEFAGIFKDICGLKPTDRVLDVGCGCGHLAMPLVQYIDAKTVYDGFDIDPVLVKWATKHITSKYLNFHFWLADVYNKHYNPGGKQYVGRYKFPWLDGTFDLVHLASVFTHMEKWGMENYVREISRVLKPGGKLLVSFFLLSDRTKFMITQGMADYKFEFNKGNYSVIDDKFTESAVAYEEDYVLGFIKSCGFSSIKVYPGSWCGRKQYTSYQDLVLAIK